jgi:hypothetical protein
LLNRRRMLLSSLLKVRKPLFLPTTTKSKPKRG